MILKNCTIFGANAIGVVLHDEETDKIKDVTTSNDILQELVVRISKSYANNNLHIKIPTLPLIPLTFQSEEDLEKYVNSADYIDN